MSGSVRNVYVDGCVFIGTDIGLRFKSMRGRGGIVENIYIRNIRMKDIKNEAITISTFYHAQKVTGLIPEPVTEKTPEFRNIFISDTVCLSAGRAIDILGLPEMPVSNVHLSNIQLTASQGVRCSEAQSIKIENLSVKTENYPVISIEQSRNFNIKNIDLYSQDELLVKVSGKDTKNIIFEKVNCAGFCQNILISSEVKAKEVQCI